MDERTLISTYFDRPQGKRLPGRHDVVLGIGDDGAVVRPEPGFDLVFAMDTTLILSKPKIKNIRQSTSIRSMYEMVFKIKASTYN